MFQRFIEEWQEDLKQFIYWCLVFTLFRLVFIVIFKSQLEGNYSEVPMALFLGLRLSFQTAVAICLLSFLFATLPRVLIVSWPAKSIRFVWHSIAVFFFSLCFIARIPYYELYNAAFNMMIINGLHDDKQAIFATIVQEYQLGWRLLGVALLTAVLIMAGKFFCSKLPKISIKSSWSHIVPTMLFFCVLVVFICNGGGFNKHQAVYWDNIARLNSNLLNEAILDDGQALFRVYKAQRRLNKTISKAMNKEELKKQFSTLGIKEDTSSIDAAFERTVGKPKFSTQPNNIVVLVGESFSEWPFLEKFADLQLVPQMQQIRQSPNAGVINTMLPVSRLTIKAMNCFITGLPDNNLYENYRSQSYSTKYKMGIGYIMKQLGYKTVYWYGGYGEWDNIKKFALAQSFDEVHCVDEFDMSKEYPYVTGSPWGASDELFLDNITEYIKKQKKDEKVFHLILTTSNHKPYSIDVDSIGFHSEKVKEKLGENFEHSPKMVKMLGHIWYADKTMGKFVKDVKNEKGDSLFVITGDHAERTSFAVPQEKKAIYTVPCIFYGKNVKPEWFADTHIGAHMQIAGTLAELIAPSGFVYSSLLPSMLQNNDFVFNHTLYAKPNELENLELLDENSKARMEAIKNIGIYRVLKGDTLK